MRRVVTDFYTRSIVGSRRPQWRLRIDFPSETYLLYVVGDAKATSSRRRRRRRSRRGRENRRKQSRAIHVVGIFKSNVLSTRGTFRTVKIRALNSSFEDARFIRTFVFSNCYRFNNITIDVQILYFIFNYFFFVPQILQSRAFYG